MNRDDEKWEELLNKEPPSGIIELRDEAIEEHRAGLTEPLLPLSLGDGQIDHAGHFDCECGSTKKAIYKRCKFTPNDPDSGRKVLPSLICPDCEGRRPLT